MDIKNKQALLIKKLLFIVIFGIMFINMVHAEISEEENDCRYDNNGCFADRYCYPLGYVKNEKFCTEELVIRNNRTGRVRYNERNKFINQSEIGTNCTYDFECKTNFCSGNICTNQVETEKEFKKLNKLNKEMKLEIMELSNKIDKISDISKKLEEPNNTEFSLGTGNVINSNKNNTIKKFYKWFRKLFN